MLNKILRDRYELNLFLFLFPFSLFFVLFPNSPSVHRLATSPFPDTAPRQAPPKPPLLSLLAPTVVFSLLTRAGRHHPNPKPRAKLLAPPQSPSPPSRLASSSSCSSSRARRHVFPATRSRIQPPQPTGGRTAAGILLGQPRAAAARTEFSPNSARTAGPHINQLDSGLGQWADRTGLILADRSADWFGIT